MWWHNDLLLRPFERDARLIARMLTRHRSPQGFAYRLLLPIEDVGAPQVTVVFRSTDPLEAHVSVVPWRRLHPEHNPGDLPHRYPDQELCLWYPRDARDQRWEWDDGLLELLGMTAAHLARERLWLKTGNWYGPERPHGHGWRNQRAAA